jgi:hypothetical protein
MDRIEKHLLPKRRIAERLRHAGLRVGLRPTADSYDLLVNESVRVALRVAFPRSRNQRVTVRDRHYTYNYRSWNFNFHHHGKLERRYADVVVCLAMDPRDASREEVFVIPWEAVSGKTFSLHAGRRRYAGQYAKYMNRWQVITQAVAETPERLRQVA